MYLYATLVNKDQMKGSCIPKFDEADIRSADRLEVWSSSINDAGEDFNLFKLMVSDKVISEKKIIGY